MFLDFVGARVTGIVLTALSWVANTTVACSHLSFMLDALPVATLPIYLGLGPTWGSAGFGPITFGSPVVWFV